jgi:hypothetical protein
MPMRKGLKISPVIDDAGIYRIRRTNTNEIPVKDNKFLDNSFVLFRHDSAGTVNERAAFLQVWDSAVQYGFLQHSTFCHIFRGGTPFYFGIPPQCAEA